MPRTPSFCYVLLFAAGCGVGVGETKSPGADKDAGSEKSPGVGETWRHADLIKHFESKGLSLDKAPSRADARVVYFFPKKAETPDRVPFLLDGRHHENWPADWFSATDLGDHATARATAEDALDRLNEKGTFAWGKYLFRGPPRTVADIKKKLP